MMNLFHSAKLEDLNLVRSTSDGQLISNDRIKIIEDKIKKDDLFELSLKCLEKAPES